MGETANIKKRVKDHTKDPTELEYNFHTLYVVTDDYANGTIMKHFEHLLIILMRIDKKYEVTNDINGHKYTFYVNKNKYELKFDQLWLKLEKIGIVKEKCFRNLLDTEEFKRSPFKILNQEQTKALKSIIHVLDSKETEPVDREYKARPIKIEGFAGTGKTLLAISLFDYLKHNERYQDKKIVIVVSSPSLREEIRYVLKYLHYTKEDVIAPVQLTKEKYDIVICDEAHKLRRNKNLNSYAGAFKSGNERLGLTKSHDELDWLLLQSKTLILFYDANQIVSPSAISKFSFLERIDTQDRGFRPIANW